MQISETIERECCQRQDLKPYKGLVDETGEDYIMIKTHKPVFCKYCGQVWTHTKEMGPAGSMDPSMEKVVI